MDTRPTTEQTTARDTDPLPDQPEVKSGIALPLPVSQLRWKLGRKAKREPSFRFYALYDRLFRHDMLTAAWWLVLKNHGDPGVDGQSCQDIMDGPGAAAFLQELREELRTLAIVRGRWEERHQTQQRTLLTCEFRTFVNRLVRIPGQVLQTGRQRVLRLLAWNDWQGLFFRLADALTPARHRTLPQRC